MTDLEIVQEAQKVIDEELLLVDKFLHEADEAWISQDEIDSANHFKRILFAHKAFFERHKGITHCDSPNCPSDVCASCGSKETVQCAYPCPELVAQAKAIMGVE